MAVLRSRCRRHPRAPSTSIVRRQILLKAQLEHLEAAAGKYQAESSTLRRAVKALTEADVATRIQALTRKLQLPVADERPAPAAIVGAIGESLAAARQAVRQRIAAKKSTLRKGGHKARKKD